MADKNFLDEDGVSQFAEETKKYVDKHADNADIHVTATDKANWNGKQDALTAEQLAAVNSGVSATDKGNYDAHIANVDIHVTAGDKANWNAKADISDIPDVSIYAKSEDLSAVATSGSYSDLIDTPSIPTKTSELENDSGFIDDISGKQDVLSQQQLDNIDDVPNKADKSELSSYLPLSGGTVTGRLNLNDEFRYIDTTYDWSDPSLNVWCDAGHTTWYDRTGTRRMHTLVGANGGVWRKVCFINENIYFNVNSNRNIDFYGKTFRFNSKNIDTIEEQGSGYIRYSSGLQICTGMSSAITLLPDEVKIASATFPKSFSSAPDVVVCSANPHIIASTWGISTTGCEVYLKSTSPGTGTNYGRYIAFGKWK